MSEFEAWINDPLGNRLAPLDKIIGLEIVHVTNDYGVIGIELPSEYDEYIRLDGILEVWFRGSPEAAGFIRKMIYYDDESGAERTRLIAYTGNYILTSRIVAYAAGTAHASMTDQADDMLKEIVNDNLLADDRARRVVAGLTKAANESDGVSITKGFAWQPLLVTCQDIAAASKAAGTAIYFDWLPKFSSDSRMTFEFRTWANQRGLDHGSGSGQPVYFGKSYGNLVSPSLELDHSDEVNYVYAGGQGEGEARNVNEVYDADRYNASVWNMREAFADARNESSEDGVTAKGYERLNDGRPVKEFRGQIIESPSTQYKVHWNFGDKVVCEYRDVIYDVHIERVQLTLESDGSSSVVGWFGVDE